MKLAALPVSTLVLLAACHLPLPVTRPPGPEADVYYLASPALRGRAAGSPGGDSAAEYIARRYIDLNLHGPFPTDCAGAPSCPASLFQLFNLDGRRGKNVAAVIAGTDSSLRSQYVVIGAHFDHLGQSPASANDRDLGFITRPGADDNASGTAGVLELARRFALRPARRSILVANFDAEELGMVGSRVFVDQPPIPLRSIVFMLNLDMIGRLSDDVLYVDAIPEKPPIRQLVDSLAKVAGLHAQYTSIINDRSDHASFSADGIEIAALFTGFHPDYHRISDIPSRVNYVGLKRVIDVAEGIARAEADRRVEGRE